MSVESVIAEANAILPGTPSRHGEADPRWEVIIEVSEFIESNPNEVWAFAKRWASHEQRDLQAAIATCLIEHLLEFDFATFFPLAAVEAKASRSFAQALSLVWVSGDEGSLDSEQLQQLLRSLRDNDT